MGVARRAADQRTDHRDARFSKEFSLRLESLEPGGRTIALRPMDVSPRGLGFIAKETLPTGHFYNLMIGKFRFRVELAYCTSYLGIDGLYRCGLFLREANGNLHTACEESGLLLDANTLGAF